MCFTSGRMEIWAFWSRKRKSASFIFFLSFRAAPSGAAHFLCFRGSGSRVRIQMKQQAEQTARVSGGGASAVPGLYNRGGNDIK